MLIPGECFTQMLAIIFQIQIVNMCKSLYTLSTSLKAVNKYKQFYILYFLSVIYFPEMYRLLYRLLYFLPCPCWVRFIQYKHCRLIVSM